MNIVWHIFKKDAFRLRWILALWLALPVAQMIYVWLAPLPLPGQEARGEIIRYFFVLLTLIQAVVSYLLVMSLLDDDPLAGNQAFWPTRPISGRQLLGAKLLGLVVLLWLAPLAVLVPWWLAHGYGWQELGKAAVGVVLTQAWVTLLALPLAALSPKSGVFLVLTGVGLLAPFLGLAAAAFSTKVALGVQESRGYLGLALWLATVVGVTAHQFLTRRTLRSAGLFVGGWVGIFCVLCWWPWDFASKISWSHESALAANLTLQPQSARVATVQPGFASAGVFTLQMQLSGLPEPYSVVIDSAKHTFTWGAQTDMLSSDQTAWLSEYQAVARAMALHGKPDAPASELRSMVTIRTKTLTERLLREAPAYSGVLRGRIMRPVVVADLPLTAGESMQQSGYGVRVETVQPMETGGFQAVVRVSSADAEPVGIGSWMGMDFYRSSIAIPEYYFLVNRHLGKIEWLTVSRPVMLGCIGTMGVYWQRFSFGAHDGDSRLVKVVFRPVDEFKRKVASPRLGIVPSKD